MSHLLVAISSHGYGHAAQTAPVVNALRRRFPDLRVTLRTDLPQSFLMSRFAGALDVIPGGGDFGLVMQSALAIDREASAERYAALHANWDRHVETEAERLSNLKPDLVLSNVSYLALAGASATGIRGIAYCSFTWSLIYEYYFLNRPEAKHVLAQMRAAYRGAQQVLAIEPGMPLDVDRCHPIGVIAQVRSEARQAVRAYLSVEGKRLVALSLGGVRSTLDLTRWPRQPDIHWLVPRAIRPTRPDMTAHEELPFNFTELLAAADAFVTKAGYGNFTEAACHGVPVLCVRRNDWPEEPWLVNWLERHGRIKTFAPELLETGDLRSLLEEVWRLPAPPPVIPLGIEAASRQISEFL